MSKVLERTNEKVREKTNTDNDDFTRVTFVLDNQDLFRIYRRDQIMRKKIKGLHEGNSQKQKEIKVLSTEINNQRTSICFNVSCLLKELSIKNACKKQVVLQSDAFAGEKEAHTKIQEIIQTYEDFEHESNLMTKCYDILQTIYCSYEEHAQRLKQLVTNYEENNKNYVDRMDDLFDQLNTQIKEKIKINQDIAQKSLDAGVQAQAFYQQGVRLNQEYDKLQKERTELQSIKKVRYRKVEDVSKWKSMVIKKCNKGVMGKVTEVKRRQLENIMNQNMRLQLYDSQLKAEQMGMMVGKKEKKSREKRGVE